MECKNVQRLLQSKINEKATQKRFTDIFQMPIGRGFINVSEVPNYFDENTYKKLKLKTIKIEQGCSKCNYSGYKGRIAVYEILEINKRIKHSIIDSELSDEIYNLGKLNGMISFQDSCSYLLKNGAKIAEVQAEMDERQFGESYLNMINSIKYMVKMIVSIVLIQNVRKRG